MNRRCRTMAVIGIVLWSIATPGCAQTASTDAESATQLEAEMHRTMASLIEARAAKPPTPQVVEQLTMKLQSLRARIVRKAGTPGQGWGGAGCPLARGGGRGLGPCGLGPGAGMGQGRGRGRGQGWGRGRGRGFGPGFVDKDADGICDNAESR